MDKDIGSKISRNEFEEVFRHISIPRNPPHMVLIAGPCRVGTTALSNVYARTGFESYMQPIKSMRRAIEESENIIDFRISDRQPVVLAKETFGVMTESEFFDPIDILVNAGYPKEKISLIAIMREPERTLTSWTWMWDKVPAKGFIRAYQDTLSMVYGAEKMGISTTHYVHEAIKDNNPEIVVDRLFDRTLPRGLNSRASSVNWAIGDNFDSLNEVKFFDEPPERFIHAVKTWGSYQYRELVPDLTEKQKEYLSMNKVYEIYNLFRSRCQNDLDIQISNKNNTGSKFEVEEKE